MNKRWICRIVFWSCSFAMMAQNTPFGLYREKGGDFLPLYNGIMEPGYLHGYENTPYWPQEHTKGSLVHKGWLYEGVEMLIDTYRQCLIVLSNDRKRCIEVPQDEIQEVEIGGVEYVWRTKAEGAPANAYYGIVYAGKEDTIYRLHYAMAPRKKIAGRSLVMEFDNREDVYIVRNGKWHELNGISSYAKLHKRQKEKLLHFYRAQRLSLKSDKDWKRLASYCETLKNESDE